MEGREGGREGGRERETLFLQCFSGRMHHVVSSPGSAAKKTPQATLSKAIPMTRKQELQPNLLLEGQHIFFYIGQIFAFPTIKLL
jgi:hypothetical protein